MAEEHLSPDGRWRWDGSEWVPVPSPEAEPAPVTGTFDEEVRGALRARPRRRGLGESDLQVPPSMRGDVLARLRRPVRGQRRIAVISRKGGVGKTTTTLMVGHVLAYARGDRVLALDANPDAGSLGHRVQRETELSVNDVLRRADPITSYVEMRRFTSQAPSRLEVLGSDQDPLLTEGLGHDEYARVMSVLRLHYGIVLCDTGTGVLDASTRGILALADQVVICTAAALDAFRAALRTIDWLEQHGYEGLARRGVVVVNAVQSGTSVDVGTMERELAGRCREVVRVPWDEKLFAGAETGFEELREATQRAYVRIAAAVADGFDDEAVGESAVLASLPPPPPTVGPDGAELQVEVIPWKDGTALLGRDLRTGRAYALEFPRVVRGGRDAGGRRLLVHRTRAGGGVARVMPATEDGDGRPVLEAPGVPPDAAGGARLVDATLGDARVRVLLCPAPLRVIGVDVSPDPAYRPVDPRPDDGAADVLETDLRLVDATLVTDEDGAPVALDAPAPAASEPA